MVYYEIRGSQLRLGSLSRYRETVHIIEETTDFSHKGEGDEEFWSYVSTVCGRRNKNFLARTWDGSLEGVTCKDCLETE